MIPDQIAQAITTSNFLRDASFNMASRPGRCQDLQGAPALYIDAGQYIALEAAGHVTADGKQYSATAVARMIAA
jgi:hypothetical protein